MADPMRAAFFPFGPCASGFALIFALAMPCAAHGQAEAQWTVVDRVVATIDGEPILLSDILMEKRLGLLEGETGMRADPVREAFLNRLLILREVEEVGGFRLSTGLEGSAYQGYLGRFGGPEGYRQQLARWGTDDAEVRRRLNRALLASLYTENRIRFFVRVLPADVEKAYAQSPSRWGGNELAVVWDQVREALEEEAFDNEKARWLDSLASRYRLRRLDAEGAEEP